MMEQRQALTLPATVEKDNLMENPLKIPKTCLSTDCGKLEGQVSWTIFAGCKIRHPSSSHKNGSIDRNCPARISLEMSRRTPQLVLTDILKTELGKSFVEKRMKKNHSASTKQQVVAVQQRTSGRVRSQSVNYNEKSTRSQSVNYNEKSTRSPSVNYKSTRSQSVNYNEKSTRTTRDWSVTPQAQQKTSPPSIDRSKLRRKLLGAVDQVDKEEKEDTEEVEIVKKAVEDDKFAQVVDCGLSVTWDHAEDTEDGDEFSSVSIKEKLTESENDTERNLKRKMKDSESQCNGTKSPKRHRESVLRLTGEDRRERSPTPETLFQEESLEDADLENLDSCIVQFTVGGDDQTKVLLPVSSPFRKDGDAIKSPKQSQENNTEPIRSEPIILSSEDEEGEDEIVRTVVTGVESVIQGRPSPAAVAKLQDVPDLQDMEVVQVVIEDVPRLLASSPIQISDYSSLAFFALHCGGYSGKSNGEILIEADKTIIPLKDTRGEMKLTLQFASKELRRYSVWEQEELQARGLRFKDDDVPCPSAVLLFYVSESAAAAIQRDLCQLGFKNNGTTKSGKASPFILLTLKDPLEGVKGALLRSVLDIECINTMGQEQTIMSPGAENNSDLEDFLNPVLSLDNSIELIKRTGLDSHLLSMLGVESAESAPDVEPDSPPSVEDEKPATLEQPDVRPEEEPHVPEPETKPTEDEAKKDEVTEGEVNKDEVKKAEVTQGEATEDVQKEEQGEEPEKLPEKKKEEPAAAYTLCHRRTKHTYSVSLCKADPRWTKYKHLGLARRLIQFPPPPLKGGITVTMEDLQCLDNGQFLNDVIIDFYLKYLLQNASASVAERSHIFSSFFYKQLTRRDNASEGASSESCQRQRRHQRVKTWTRHVDIFKKDFLFVPVNQEAHWYVVVICFPGLEEPTFEAWTGRSGGSEAGSSQYEEQGCKSPVNAAETPPTLTSGNIADAHTEKAQENSTKISLPGPVNCTELTCQRKTVCKRPCIFIMDSLKLSLHERVFKLLREYLQSEWEVRRGSSREFGPDQMKGSYCKVPLQDNSSDCGLYLLQYVECFLKDPVVHFELPLCLERWFPRQQVRRKRDDIRDLILNLYRHQNLENRHVMKLPEFF